MSQNIDKVRGLLSKGPVTSSYLCKELGVTGRQLFSRYILPLKQKGMLIVNNGNEDGELIFSISQDCKNFYDPDCTLLSGKKKAPLRAVAISDLHFSNTKENLERLNNIFDYCVANNIHVIFCCGDLIDGTFSRSKKVTEDGFIQIEHLFKDYPYDDSIVTYAIGGDHDESMLKNGYDVINALNNYRPDIIINNYGHSYIKIRNSEIELLHPIDGKNKKVDTSIPLSLQGHNHIHKIQIIPSDIIHATILVPSISDITPHLTAPEMLDLTLDFTSSGELITTNCSSLMFDSNEKLIKCGETEINHKIR